MADEKVLIEIEIDNAQAIKNEKELIAQIERQRIELQRNRKELKASNGSNKEAAEAVGRLTRQISSNTKQLRQEQKEIKASNNSINGLRASVSRLTAERNNLDTSTANGRKEFDRLTLSIREQTDKLKELEGATGDFRRNVGNYTDSVKEALQGVDLLSGGFGALAANFRVFITATRAAVPAIGALRVALIALPILAIVTALAALVTFFTKTKRGAEILERGLGAIGAVVTKLTDDFASVGESIFDAVTNPKQSLIDLGNAIKENLINRLKSVSVFIEAVALVFEGEYAAAAKKAADASIQFATGVENGTDKLKEGVKETIEYANSLNDAATAGFNAADANIRLRQSIRNATIEAAKQERLAEEARKNRDDERLSLEERLEANNKVLQAEQARLTAEKQITNARLQILNNERTLSGRLSEEQLTERAELLAELQRLEADFAGRTTEQLTEEVAITREAAAQKAQARLDGLNAELLALEEGSALFLEKQIEILNAEAELQRTAAEAEITNEENLAARLALIEAERIAAIKALKDEQEIDDKERGEREIATATKNAERLRKIEEAKAKAEEDKKIAAIEANQLAAGSAVESANTIEEAGKIVINSIRKQIKAYISEAIAAAVAKELVKSNVLFPFNIILATAAGAAASVLFDSLIPGFATGGIVSGGMPIKRSNGDNRLATLKTGEVVVNRKQRSKIGDATFARAGVPGFANGGVVGASVTGGNVSSDVASTDAIINGVAEAVQMLPSPVLDYKEFTTFTSRVTLKENRASV